MTARPRPTRRNRPLGAVAAATLLIALTACSGGSEGEASCALAFERDGVTFHPFEAAGPLPEGGPLGTVSSVTCDDGNGESESERVAAVAIRGIDPDEAFLVVREGRDTVFAAGPPDGSELSPEVRALLGP